MTREEIDELKGLAASMGLYADKNPCKRAVILGKAIKALEQEPCEDAISRQAAIHACLSGWNKDYKEIVEEIRTLPPVTPQPKPGRWIEHFDESGKWYECDLCQTDWGGPVNYCPNCGAKM